MNSVPFQARSLTMTRASFSSLHNVPYERRIELLQSTGFSEDSFPFMRKHWICWEKACRPKESGGLGILSLEYLKPSLHGKLAWKIVAEDSLWCRFMKAKYGNSSKHSAVWGNIAHLVDYLKQNSMWMIGRGDVNIDVVCSSLGIQCPPHLHGLLARDALEDEQDRSLLWQFLPPRIKNIYRSFILSVAPDRFIWIGDHSGTYLLKSFESPLEFSTRGVVGAQISYRVGFLRRFFALFGSFVVVEFPPTTK
ncbi:hypothetical protein QQ045_031861 [Rhodiola kirilowii]